MVLMRDSDRNIANGQSSDKGNSSLVHNGSTLSQLDSLVTKVTSQSHRCENEQNWNGSHDPCAATPCNAPDAKFYEYFDGVPCENYLCDSCVDSLGLSAEALTRKTFKFFAADVEQRRKERA